MLPGWAGCCCCAGTGGVGMSKGLAGENDCGCCGCIPWPCMPMPMPVPVPMLLPPPAGGPNMDMILAVLGFGAAGLSAVAVLPPAAAMTLLANGSAGWGATGATRRCRC